MAISSVADMVISSVADMVISSVADMVISSVVDLVIRSVHDMVISSVVDLVIRSVHDMDSLRFAQGYAQSCLHSSIPQWCLQTFVIPRRCSARFQIWPLVGFPLLGKGFPQRPLHHLVLDSQHQHCFLHSY
jgi:hypothetical protein